MPSFVRKSLGVLLVCLAVRIAAEAEPRGFTEDPFLTDEKFREKVPTKEVIGVLGGRAEVPCDLTPPFPSDSPHLILFYKDVFGTPIYSFDMRSEGGRHWVDNETLGARGFFQFSETGEQSETGANVIHSYLGIEPLRIHDRGTYRCRVDFKEAPTKNTRIKLDLIVPPGPPVILNKAGTVLLDATDYAREDTELTLYCETIGGDPLPRLSWWRGRTILDDVVEEIDAKAFKVRNRLRLTNLQRSDHGGELTCKAYNNNLTSPVTTSIRINMVFAPVRAKIVREWSHFTVGQAYNISCQVLGSRPPAATAIFVGSSQLREVNYRLSPDGNVSTTTVIFIPSEGDQGKFLSCRAENMKVPASSVEDQWKIDVHYAPQLTLGFREKAHRSLVLRGEAVFLQCNVSANPTVHAVRWKFQGTLLEPTRANGAEMMLSEDGLLIKKASEKHSGVYECLAQNPMGSGVSNQLRVDVKASPRCSSTQITTLNVMRHESVELSCPMAANPRTGVEFRWSLNTSRDRADIPRAQFTQHGLESLLTYTPKTRLDYGTVMCFATNEIGESAQPCIYHIRPAGKPEGLKNCSTVNQTFESLTIVCQPGFSGGLDQRFMLLVSHPGTGKSILNITSNKPTFSLQGLSSGVEYNVEIFAVNSKGKSDKTFFEAFTIQPAEKQLAATTTELSSNNPMRLLPIIGVLLAIVLLLVVLTVSIVMIVIRTRNKPNRGNVTTQQTHTSFEVDIASHQLRSDDGGCSSATTPLMYDKLKVVKAPPTSSEASIDPIGSLRGNKLQYGDIQYAELSFPNRPAPPQGYSTLQHRPGLHQATVYSTLDHARRKNPGQLRHSVDCPLKIDACRTLPNRSTSSKRVAFKDEVTESPPEPQLLKSFSSEKNPPRPSIPSPPLVQMVSPMPAPPPGYESEDPTTQLTMWIEPQCNSLKRTAVLRGNDPQHQSKQPCSPVKDVESTL